MAKIGLEYVKVGKLATETSGAAATYTDPQYLGTSAGFTGNVTANDVKDYGDDRTVETDNSVTGGTLSWEKNDLTEENLAYLLGHEATVSYALTTDTDVVAGKTYYTRTGSGTTESPYVYTPVASPVKSSLETYYEVTAYEILANADDVAPFIGVGVIGKAKRNGAYKYIAKFYYKTQWHEPNDENSTATDTTNFAHDTIEGAIFMLQNGDWKAQETFDTLAAAKAYIDTKFGISTP